LEQTKAQARTVPLCGTCHNDALEVFYDHFDSLLIEDQDPDIERENIERVAIRLEWLTERVFSN